ncbi:hypothetical protein [Rathayibacter tanaceti]|uniref:Uncharacterized protein n=2 Tax=Rathayibacter tanaceti TaxID=1671680 RepID=A0A162GHG1_9MICO|nr:hypothetical protein [Rathayibacter tanaceti]KZX21219.1 hypothetical protein ACH61_01634 [Rathayibacter tanaceti]QHC56807.1 hypothetical protein GSU10_15000 [Rathayibacter tanaceti]TCO37820.1 hypothetical protein EV639_1034 [Rathayibacter tanaceti]
MDSTAVARFVRHLRSRVEDNLDPRSAQLVWVRGVENADGDAVILYRESPGGPVVGRRYRLQDYAALFDVGSSPERLADIAFTDDVSDPTGGGVEDAAADERAGLDPGSGVRWV